MANHKFCNNTVIKTKPPQLYDAAADIKTDNMQPAAYFGSNKKKPED